MEVKIVSNDPIGDLAKMIDVLLNRKGPTYAITTTIKNHKVIYSYIRTDLAKNIKDKPFQDEDGQWVIDTSNTQDFGWETAIWKGFETMKVVERYKNKKLAEEGHEYWIKKTLKLNSMKQLQDITNLI